MILIPKLKMSKLMMEVNLCRSLVHSLEVKAVIRAVIYGVWQAQIREVVPGLKPERHQASFTRDRLLPRHGATNARIAQKLPMYLNSGKLSITQLWVEA